MKGHFPKLHWTWSTEAMIQILFRHQIQEISDFIHVCPTLVCSGQRLSFIAGLCNAPFMPIACLSSRCSAIHLCPLPPPCFSTWVAVLQKTLAPHREKGFRTSKISRNEYRVAKGGWKLSWLPGYSVLRIQHFTALQSFYSFTECISYQLTGCPAILATVRRAPQLRSDGVSIMLKHWWDSSLETCAEVFSSCVFVR